MLFSQHQGFPMLIQEKSYPGCGGVITKQERVFDHQVQVKEFHLFQ